MHELVLYGSSTSPFVRKVHVALIEKGLRHRFELAPPWSPTAGVERLNPLHKVPVLELSDSRRLFDSRVIVQYLDVLLRPSQSGPVSGAVSGAGGPGAFRLWPSRRTSRSM